MPFRSENPIVRVEPAGMRSIDTSNVENLFGLWTVFSKCAGTMEDGRRLENMSWRLWNRETFCCAPDRSNRSQRIGLERHSTSDSLQMPELSSSVESEVSITQEHTSTCPSARPELRRFDSSDTKCCRNQKHITPVDLQKIVISIKEQQELEPLAPLPLSMQPPPPKAMSEPRRSGQDTTPRPSSSPLQTIPESSTSTVATVAESEISNMSPPVGSDVSTSTDLSSHSVVRGFSLGRASSSFRSKTQLAPPASILKNSPQKVELRRMEPKKIDAQKKKGAMFQLGTSSDEDGTSSLETPFIKHNLPVEGLKKLPTSRKPVSFKIESDDEEAYDSEAISSDEEDPSESAIDDDDDDENAWSDEEDSEPSSVNGSEMFTRVDSRPNLTHNRSLITTALHEQDRVKALQNEASRSSPAIRRSRTSSPNGPSLAASPRDKSTHLDPRGISIPVIMTTSNTHPPALSPRTTRRNMLSTELTESLRKHLLWERQQKNATSNAALKRRHTSNDIKNLKQYPETTHTLAPIREHAARDTAKSTNSWNAYFDQGLQEYHHQGW